MSLMFKAWRMSDESVQVRKALEAIRNVFLGSPVTSIMIHACGTGRRLSPCDNCQFAVGDSMCDIIMCLLVDAII